MKNHVLAVLIGILAALAAACSNATAQAVIDGAQALAQEAPPDWAECVLRALAAVVACTAVVEGLRWVVPGWEREPGARLSPAAKRVLFVLVIVAGQVGAWLQWPSPFVRTPWPGEYWPAAGAGLAVSVGALVFNEAIWKRIVTYVQERWGVMPKRVKERRAEVTPGPTS